MRLPDKNSDERASADLYEAARLDLAAAKTSDAACK